MTSATGPSAADDPQMGFRTAEKGLPLRVGPGAAGPVVVVLDDAALPSGLSRLRVVVRDAFLDGETEIVVDVAGLRRLSSATVAALLWANRHCRQRGGAVVLLGPSESSLDVLRRTGLGEVLRVQSPEDLALSS